MYIVVTRDNDRPILDELNYGGISDNKTTISMFTVRIQDLFSFIDIDARPMITFLLQNMKMMTIVDTTYARGHTQH